MTRISYKWANKTPKLKIHNSTKTKTTHVSPLKNDNNRSKRNSHQTFPILIDKKWSSRTSSSKPKFMNWPNKWTKSWPGKRNPKSTEFMPINKKMKSSKPKNNNWRNNKLKYSHSKTRSLWLKDNSNMCMIVEVFRASKTNWKICKKNCKPFKTKSKPWWKWRSSKPKRSNSLGMIMNMRTR